MKKIKNSPICKTFETDPLSNNFIPWWNGNFCLSLFSFGEFEKLEYIQISRSFRGNDQYTIRLWTGSGIRSKRSSTFWNGIFSATTLAQISRRDSGLCFPQSRRSLAPGFEPKTPRGDALRLFAVAIDHHLASSLHTTHAWEHLIRSLRMRNWSSWLICSIIIPVFITQRSISHGD